MRPPALGYRLRAGLRAYGTSNMTNVKLLNQDNKTNARHSESWRDRRQDEYVHSLRIPFLRSSTSFIRTPALARGRNQEPREAGALGGTRNRMVVGGPLSQNLTRARSKILCRTVLKYNLQDTRTLSYL